MVSTQTVNLSVLKAASKPHSSPHRVLLASVALLALYSVPLFSTVLPPLFDYPNHLARFAVLAAGGSEFYEVRWAPLPNLAGDIIVPLLARAMPLEIAGKLFLVMIFALILGGTASLNRVVGGAWRLWPLLAAAFLYNLTLLWGSVNFLFGLGVALCGAALWLALENRRIWLRISASVLVALLCFFSHIAALGLYGLIVFGMEAQPTLAEWRRGRWTVLVLRAALFSAQFLIPAAIVAFWWHPSGEGQIVYPGSGPKMYLLFGVLYNYSPVLVFACYGLLLALLGGLAWRRRLNISPRLAPGILLILLAYLLLPTEIASAKGIDHRLVVGFFLLVVAAAVPHFPNRKTAIAIGSVTCVLLFARLAVVEAAWLEGDRTYRADLSAIDALPAGTKLAVAYPKSALQVLVHPEVHLPTLAVTRRQAFVPTLFAFPDQQPIALKPPYEKLAAAADPYELWAGLMMGDDAARRRTLAALAGYDAIVFVNHEPFQLPREDCLRPLFRRPTFQIYTLVHGGDCPEQR